MKPRTPHPLRDPACNLCDVIAYGYFQQLRRLICSGIELECRDACRRTPIMQCAFMEPESWGVGIARALIENGVRLDRKDRFGRNVLHYACIYERLALINVLLKAIDFDLNQPDKLGNTALHYAAMSGNIATTQVVSQFFRKYKISPSKPNKKGRTAAEEAYSLANIACARLVEQHDADNSKVNSAGKEIHFNHLISTGNTTIYPCIQSKDAQLTLPNRHSLRPLSATFLTRRDSTISYGSFNDRRSSYSFRSRSNHSDRGYSRYHQNPLLAMGIKREEDVIPCANEKDFRNTPDFVFKLLRLDVNEWHPLHEMDSSSKNNAWAETTSTNQSQTIPIGSRPDWRHELKHLFKVDEQRKLD